MINTHLLFVVTLGVIAACAKDKRVQRWFHIYDHNRMIISPQKCALIVLDALETYRNTFTPRRIRKLVSIIKDAQRHNIPVIATRWIRTRGMIGDIVDECKHWTEFLPHKNEPFLKELSDIKWDLVLHTVYTDAFAPVYNDGRRQENVLRTFLTKHGVEHLVLTGTWAEACVERTAYTASTHFLRPIVYQPGCGGYVISLAMVLVDGVRGHVTNHITFDERVTCGSERCRVCENPKITTKRTQSELSSYKS